MRVLASRRGFSLVELLTVIAIIAILASIIFPVMGMVKNRANLTKCMTQLHEIGLAVQVFKQDNRRYPDILGAQVVRQGGIVPFDQANNPRATAVGLYPEYVKAARLYHCPNSKSIDMQGFKVIPVNGTDTEVYSYDSYDFMIYPGEDVRQHYTRSWATANSGQAPADAVKAVVPDDTRPSPVTGDATRDYERQLKFRTPPDTTVVTWCSWHETVTGSGSSLNVSGKTPTLYVDGHVDSQNAADVETYRWRLMPRKE